MESIRRAELGDVVVYSYGDQKKLWWGIGTVSNVNKDGLVTHVKNPGSNSSRELDRTAWRKLVQADLFDRDRLLSELDFDVEYLNLEQAKQAIKRFMK